MQTIKDSIKTVIVSLVALSLVSVAYAAWTEPASNPPAGNTNPPITTASNTQTKTGWFTADNIEAYGTTYLATATNKNVGIGTANPGATYKLDVAGAINATTGLYVSGTRKDTVWDGKQDAIAGAASTITTSNLTANRALVSDASGKVAASGTTSTELGYVSGVTSAIQTQLNAKAPTASPTFTGSVTIPTPTASNHAATKGYVDALASAPVWAYRNCLSPWAPFGVTTNCTVTCPTGTTIQAWKKAYNVGATDNFSRVAIGVLNNSYETSSLGTCTLGGLSCSVGANGTFNSLGVICAK